MAKQINKALLRSILRKRKDSEPLNNEEESYARKIFSDMMDSKQSINKVVRILTGEQLRKQDKLGADATKPDPRYPAGKNPATPAKGENTDPDVVTPPSKLVDADNKPKANYSEQERLENITQEITPPRTEAVKFTSADPAKVGDVVVKNVAKTGTLILQGVVLKVDDKNQTAMVKWADKRTSVEFLHGLVKAKKSDEAAAAETVPTKDPKGVSEAEEESKNPPMTKFTKDGDIAAAKDYGMNTPAGSGPKTTPFEDLVSTLQHLVGLASELKEKQERVDDQEIKDYYDQLLSKLRSIAETILAGLDMELKEAQSEYDEAEE